MRSANRLGLQAASLFMIYLVLSLTVLTAYSLRATAVFQGSVKGQDDISGYRRLNDTTIVTVLADTDLVNILGNPPLNLSCTSLDNGQYACSYTFPYSSQGPGQYKLDVRQETNPPQTTSLKYSVDGTPPHAETFLPLQRGQELSATYTVVDTASPAPGCSGLKSLQLVANEQVVATTNLSGCRAQGVIAGKAPGLSGPIELYLVMTDVLGNTGQSQKIVKTVDTVPPGLPSGYTLLRGGRELTAYSTEAATTVTATLKFHLTEDLLDTVTVNATSLNPSAVRLAPGCAQNGTGYDCTVPVTLKPTAPSGETSFPITITARDRAGNTARGVAYTTLQIENTKPVITYLGRPDQCATCYATNGPTRVVALVEAPGGMASNGLFFSTNRQTVQASCNSTGGTWTCIADVPFRGAHGSEQRLSVTPNSMDDLGNLMTGTLEKRFLIDTKKPEITEKPSVDVACPVAGQTLTVTFDAKDDSQKLFITANTSSVTDRDEVRAVCEQNEPKTFHCSLPIDGFFSTHTNGDVPITVADEAGNEQRLLLKVEVCEAEGEVTPNYITSVAPSGQLPVVDKRIASLVPFKVLLPLTLSLVGRARVSQVRSVRCTTPQIVGAYVMNEFSKSPILVTSYYSNSVWPNGTVSLNCTLDFTMRRGNVVYLKPERENLSLELPLVGQELGNPGEAIRAKEQALVADINKLQEKIKSKAAIDNSLGKICRLAETIGNVNAALQAVKSLLYGIATLFSWAGAAAFWVQVNEALSGFHAIVNNFVWPEGWLPTGQNTIGLLVKTLCGLYTCKIYDAGTWAGFIMEASIRGNWLGIGSLATPTPKEEDIGISEDGHEYEFEDGKWVRPGESYDPGELRLVRAGNPLTAYRGSDGSIYVYNQEAFEELYLSDTQSKSNFNEWLSSGEGVRITYEDILAGATPSTQTINWIVNQTFAKLSDEIQGDNWIVNPFRSTRYDSMCIPAQLYNLRKEKQLKCIELKCIREMAPTGLPITQCEQKYAAQACLYLESAQARMHGSISEILQNAVKQIAIQLIIGTGTLLIFYGACHEIYVDMITVWDPLPVGFKSVACGLTGTAFALREIQSFLKGIGVTNPTVPNGPDFCEGIEGVEPDDTVEEGGGFI